MNKAILENLNEKGVLTLTLNRPDVLNAMNADLILGLLESINKAKSNKQVRSVIITGNGRGFVQERILLMVVGQKQRDYLQERQHLQIWRMLLIP